MPKRKKSFAEQIDELDAPNKDEALEPRTPLAIFLSQQRLFDKPYLHWRRFLSVEERDLWEQIEKDYPPQTIKESILFWKGRRPPRTVVAAIILGVTNNTSPKTLNGISWDEMTEV